MIPKHFRQIKDNEVIRKGDMYQSAFNSTITGIVKFAVGKLPTQYGGAYLFFRRRHVKVTPTVNPANCPTVTFSYQKDGESKTRTVQVVRFDDAYLKGFEGQQFKSFRRDRMGNVILDKFVPAS